MKIEDIDLELPNGFHDASLRAFSSDLNARTATFIMDVWVGDVHSEAGRTRERRLPARLELSGLTYLVAEPPDPSVPVPDPSKPVQIDLCEPDTDVTRNKAVPQDGFAGRFFVSEWNAFIHFAARNAELTWIETN